MREATCCPDKPHFAKGLCQRCYDRERGRLRKAQCDRSPSHRERVRRLYRKAGRKQHGCINPHGETKFGPCEICGRVQQLAYDHNHATGLFRGWLCRFCNISFGWFENNKKGILEYEKRNAAPIVMAER